MTHTHTPHVSPLPAGGTYREALIDGWLKGTVPTQWQGLDTLVRSKEQPDTDWWTSVSEGGRECE